MVQQHLLFSVVHSLTLRSYSWCVSLNSFRWILCYGPTVQIKNHKMNWYACQVCVCCYNSRRHHIINRNWKSTKIWTRIAAENATRMSKEKFKNFIHFMKEYYAFIWFIRIFALFPFISLLRATFYNMF